jgi:hypothetical protein
MPATDLPNKAALPSLQRRTRTTPRQPRQGGAEESRP